MWLNARENNNEKRNGKTLQRFFQSFLNASRPAAGSMAALFINYTLLHYKSDLLLNTYVYCVAVCTILQVLCNWGGKEFSVKELSTNVALQVDLTSQFLISRGAMLLFIAPLLLLFPNLQHKVFILLLLGLRSFTSVFEALALVQKAFRFSLIADALINGTFLLVLLSDGNKGDVSLFMKEWLIIEAVRFMIYAWRFKSYLKPSLQIFQSFRLLKQAFPFFAVALAGFCCSRADLYVLGVTMPAPDFSRYSILLNFIILCQVLFGSFFGAFSSNIYRYRAASFKAFGDYVLKAGVIMALCGTLAVYILSVAFFGAQPGIVFLILAFINLFSFTGTFIAVFYFTKANRQYVILKVIVVAGVFNICASVFLVRLFGIDGAFLSNTFCAAITSLWLFIETRRSSLIPNESL